MPISFKCLRVGVRVCVNADARQPGIIFDSSLSHEGLLIILTIEQLDPQWKELLTQTLLTSEIWLVLFAKWLNSPESVISCGDIWALREHTVPKAGALALLQRTAAGRQTEKGAIRQQSRQEGGEREKGHKGGSSWSQVSWLRAVQQLQIIEIVFWYIKKGLFNNIFPVVFSYGEYICWGIPHNWGELGVHLRRLRQQCVFSETTGLIARILCVYLLF